MEARRPNGDVVLATGSKEEMEKLAEIEVREHQSEVKIHKEGESFHLPSGQKVTVTRAGLKLEAERKKKARNRIRNKAARAARRKNRK